MITIDTFQTESNFILVLITLFSFIEKKTKKRIFLFIDNRSQNKSYLKNTQAVLIIDGNSGHVAQA